MRSLGCWIERHAAFTPDKTALTCGDASVTYRQFGARIAQLAQWMEQEKGVKSGERVAWLGHNAIDLVALLIACSYNESVFVPLNWRLSLGELNDVLDDAEPALLIVDRTSAEHLEGLAIRHPVLSGFNAPGCATLPGETADVALEIREVDPAAANLLVYTSGTTGRAKGVVLSHEALLFNALNAVHMHDMTAHDRVLTVLPLFHVGGLNIQTLPALYCGAAIELAPKFDPALCLTSIASYRPSLTTLVPAMLNALMDLRAWSAADLSSLRSITTGSTDVPQKLLKALQARNVPVIQIYGATETGPVAVYQRIDEAFTTLGSIGRAGLHTEVRLVDRGNCVLPNNTAGEIQVRGAHIASGYWDRDTRRPQPFKDGWFASGDVAERDDAGLYWFKDRIKHVIISGGENIYPAELERILHASSLLREAAVAGKRDEKWGEVPIVVAVKSAPAVDEQQVLALFDQTLARYKRPRGVIFVDALPRNVLGKIEVSKLRDITNRPSTDESPSRA